MAELQLWTNDYDTVVAESAKEAAELMLRQCGADQEDIDTYCWEEFELHEKQGDAELTIVIDDEPVKKTVRDWIAENGKGLLCSTEY